MRVKMLLVPLAASLALLAGCATGSPTPAASPTPSTNGVDTKDAEGILDAGVAALTDAESFRLAGSLGEAAPNNLDVDLTYAGDNAQGTATYLGAKIELVKVADEVYLKADASLYEQFLTAEQQSLVAQLDNHWVKVPVSLVGGFVPLPLTVADWFTDDKVARPLTKGEVGALDGQPVVTITDKDGSVYSVALQGEPYILQITTPDGNPVTFSDFDKSVDITAPDGALDIMTLFGLG